MRFRHATLAALAALVLTACGAAGETASDGATQSPPVIAQPADGWEELLPNPRRPEPGILSGGQPSVEQLARARELGFRTVINLRAQGEPGTGAADVEALGMRYLAVPIRGAAGLNEDNARAFAAALETAERPVMVHCGSGNRVGALFALKAFYVDGIEPEEALDLGNRSGLTRLAGAVREHLERATGDR